MDYIHFGIFYKKSARLNELECRSYQIQKGNSGKTPFTLLWLHSAPRPLARYSKSIMDAGCIIWELYKGSALYSAPLYVTADSVAL